MDGILNIHKPLGKTSFSVVSLVKRLSGEKRVGHAGTLDPLATGVLPVCLGQGTRVSQFLLDAPKSYRAEIEFGVATDTDDATGKIISRGDSSGISRRELLKALNSFYGLISQTPPMYSAVKHHGEPLYKLARRGIEVERKSRLRRIYQLELTTWKPPVATVEVECSRGTYIRALARDLGQLLGCGAHLKGLIRLGCGPFSLEDSVSLSQLDDAFHYGYWPQFIYPIDWVLLNWVAVVVDSDAEVDIKKGRPLVFAHDSREQPSPGERCRVYGRDGFFLAVLKFDSATGRWQPEKVFTSP